MHDLVLTLPGSSLVGAKIPRQRLAQELRLRLAMALFSDGVLSGASACEMAGVNKAEFQFMLGERGICQPLMESDVDQDAANLALWKEAR